MKLICLPYAGADIYTYRNMQRNMAETIEVVRVELPGRGARSNEPLLTDLHEIVTDLFDHVRPALSQPYAFFGHSMGAMLAYLLTRRIIAAGMPAPRHLFCSGFKGPSLRVNETQRHLLPRRAFYDMLRRMGGIQDELLDDQDAMEYFEPILRADFQALDVHVYRAGDPFAIGTTILLGREDTVTSEQAQAWQKETTSPVEVIWFPGGHFFIFENLAEVGTLISRTLLERTE